MSVVVQIAHGNAWKFDQKLSAGENECQGVGDISYCRHAVYGEEIRARPRRNDDGRRSKR